MPVFGGTIRSFCCSTTSKHENCPVDYFGTPRGYGAARESGFELKRALGLCAWSSPIEFQALADGQEIRRARPPRGDRSIGLPWGLPLAGLDLNRTEGVCSAKTAGHSALDNAEDWREMVAFGLAVVGAPTGFGFATW